MLFAIYSLIVKLSKTSGGAGMIATGSRESVIQNLEDAGCENEMIQDFNCWNTRGNICLAGCTRMKKGFPAWII